MTDIVQTDGVAYRYPQNNHGLGPISLAVQPGNLLLVTGPSGCGKSTLARCLTGLIPHLYRGQLSGAVWLDGLRTDQAPLWQLTERAGLVFQNPANQMLAVTVEEEIVLGLENLGLPPAEIGIRLDAALERGQILSESAIPDTASHFTHRASRFTLQVSNLSVKLGGRPVLQDLSFSAGGGQVLALVGRNGVGKTTLLRSLAGLQKHAGAVAVNGDQPDLGMVFQNPDLQLFNATVRDEILYRLPNPDLDRYAWLMAMLGLEHYQDAPPLLLSEGEKKRVALATVLMRGPRHGVLLDEPALGQDTAHKERLIRLAHALAQAGQLVIMTTHDLTLAVQADRLLLLGRDGFVADGPPADILRDETPWAKVGLHVPEWIT